MFWYWTKRVGLCAAALGLILVVSFSFALLNSLATSAIRPIGLKDLGQGIYRLEVDLNSDSGSEILEKSLVKFRQNHPDLRIVATPTSRQDGYGVIKEVIIITEPK